MKVVALLPVAFAASGCVFTGSGSLNDAIDPILGIIARGQVFQFSYDDPNRSIYSFLVNRIVLSTTYSANSACKECELEFVTGFNRLVHNARDIHIIKSGQSKKFDFNGPTPTWGHLSVTCTK